MNPAYPTVITSISGMDANRSATRAPTPVGRGLSRFERSNHQTYTPDHKSIQGQKSPTAKNIGSGPMKSRPSTQRPAPPPVAS